MFESSFGTTDFDNQIEEVEVWHSLAPQGYPDYEVSDMGRVRCTVDRKGHKAPFFPTIKTAAGRPTVLLRTGYKQQTRRIDELVLAAFNSPRPADHWVPQPTNGDKMDVRADNLNWIPGERKVNRIRRTNKTTKKNTIKMSKEIRHGHWLGMGNVLASVQPNGMVELTVSEDHQSIDHHTIPAKDLDDAIRVLQAAKTIIEA
jgi:hypothetical protein